MPSPADWEEAVLTDLATARVLASLTADRSTDVGIIESLRKSFGRERAEAMLRLALARRKAAGKFPESERLWLDPVRAEQATHQLVANHKAKRFKGLHVADICCGLGGDSLALARLAGGVVSVDMSRDALRRLQFNVEVLGQESQILLVQGDAERDLVCSTFAIHIDPDRRPGGGGGRPSFSLDGCRPGLATLLKYMKRHESGAIKLSPGSDFQRLEKEARRLGIRTETEVISLGGECKEATVWFGGLAGSRERRATILPDAIAFESEMQSVDCKRDQALPKPGVWLMELDAAIVRAGLAHAFAERHSLETMTDDAAWLFSNQLRPELAGFGTYFQVFDSCAADRRAIRQMMWRLGWLTAVVKSRGRLSSAEIQKWLEKQPDGVTAETLIVITVPGQTSCAIAARRLLD
jgi:hypothetical protein